MSTTPAPIKVFIESRVSKQDVYGNCYHVSYIYSVARGRSECFKLAESAGNVRFTLSKLGFAHDEMLTVEAYNEPKREILREAHACFNGSHIATEEKLREFLGLPPMDKGV